MDGTRTIKWRSCFRKSWYFFYYFGATYMLAFYVAYPSIHIFQSCISHPFYKIKNTQFLQSHVIPVFIRSIATHPDHIFFFRMAYPMLFGVVSRRLRAANQPYPKPPSPVSQDSYNPSFFCCDIRNPTSFKPPPGILVLTYPTTALVCLLL